MCTVAAEGKQRQKNAQRRCTAVLAHSMRGRKEKTAPGEVRQGAFFGREETPEFRREAVNKMRAVLQQNRGE